MPSMEGVGGARVHLTLLGGFTATVEGVPVPDQWRLRKAKTLVKMLALAPGHQLHRERALSELWPDAGAAAAVNNLHQAVHAVRKALGTSRLVLRDDVLHLCPDDELVVDVERFEAAADEALTVGDPRLLRTALQLGSGELLPEDEYAEWVAPARARLDELRLDVSLALAERLLADQDATAALQVLEPLALERPVDERVHRALVGALAEAGRRWDAVAAYERLREALDEQYAAEPEPDTRALYRRLLTGTAPAPGERPHNLPQSATSFVGRLRELQELLALLGRTRLLTLSGPGGAGKSRLALEAARRALATAEHADGVWLVELAGVKDDELVGSAAAAALQLSLSGRERPTTALATQLSGRNLLLVLDNCEHLLGGSQELVRAVLERCPDLTVLATSREPLGLEGEVVYRVPSLEVPPPHGRDTDQLVRTEAVTLFLERARQAAPRFELTTATADAVATICHRLDGMPLALELAAARLAHLSVAELAERLHDALTLLARRGRGGLDRQQTLAATLDWSHQLLDPVERAAFRRLSVFAGGFALDAAERVCGPDAVEVLSRLVDKSLVEADTSGEVTRYRLLEVVRQYADARLQESGDAAEARGLHRGWYVEQATAHDPDRGVPVVGDPPAWFDLEQDNLRTALASALDDDARDALRLATATWRFWMSRGLIAEGDRWLTLALGACREPSVLRARALAGRAVLHVRQGRWDELTDVGDQIVDLLAERGSPAELAHGKHQRMLLAIMRGEWLVAEGLRSDVELAAAPYPWVASSVAHLAGVFALNRGDHEGARGRFLEALEQLTLVPPQTPPFFVAATLAWMVDDRPTTPLCIGEETLLPGRQLGAAQAVAYVTVALALVERLDGRFDAALALIDDAHHRFDRLGDRYGVAYCAAQLGHTLRWAEEPDDADAQLARSEALRRELSDTRGTAMAVSGRAIVSAGRGDTDDARTRAREALLMMERSGDLAGVALTSGNLAVVEQLLDEREAALRWLGRALTVGVPGWHRSVGWFHLVRAHLLHELGRPEASRSEVSAARDIFDLLREQRGLAALLRACKDGRVYVADTVDG